MTTELTLLAWTLVLGLVQLFVVAQFFTAANGLGYGMSSRDTPPPAQMSVLGGRLERAFKNLMETLPTAVAAIRVGMSPPQVGSTSASDATARSRSKR